MLGTEAKGGETFASRPPHYRWGERGGWDKDSSWWAGRGFAHSSLADCIGWPGLVTEALSRES